MSDKMIFGFFADSHEDDYGALPHILEDMRKRGVTHLFIFGDIHKKHLTPEYLKANFHGFKMIYCALVDDEAKEDFYKDRERFPNWEFTRNPDRIVRVGGIGVNCGHKRGGDFWFMKEHELMALIEKIRSAEGNDGLRIFGAGHLHRASMADTGVVRYVNPGMACGSPVFGNGCEYAVMYPDTGMIVFCRILLTTPIIKPFTVGIVGETADISLQDPRFWPKLEKEFHDRDVTSVILLGVDKCDIDKPVLADFEKVHFIPTDGPDESLVLPKGWEQIIVTKTPIVTINGYRFLIKPTMGLELEDQDDHAMAHMTQSFHKQYPNIKYTICGGTQLPFYQEGFGDRIINPGNANGRNFVTAHLPDAELTFARVLYDQLPPVKR